MRLKLFFLVIVVFSCKTAIPLSKSYPKTSPLREMRGVWIASIENIDWPSKRTLTSEAQKLEFENIIKRHNEIGINTAFVQVRAASDAFYANQTEPWSEWLTGTQGKAPEPFYDPMEFMINTCHNHNIKFHAWLNLNRGVHKSAKSISENHITKTKPEWFFSYGGYTLYNFGIPEVRKYITEIVSSIVKNYDIDGLHFDDYFYPYTIENEALPDLETFKKYPNGIGNIEDWRRNNIDLLIKDIAKTIKEIKPHVVFGVSPFGVWKNSDQDALGSPSQAGQTSFYNLYADTRKWSKENWVDYMAPQIYFSSKHPKVPYGPLKDWWLSVTDKRHLIIGIGAYKVNKDADLTWQNPSELPNQIKNTRKDDKAKGFIFFSSKSIESNPLGIRDSLKTIFKNVALQPEMSWIKANTIPKPEFLGPELISATKLKLSWQAPSATAVLIYVFPEGATVDYTNASFIYKKLPKSFGNTLVLDHKGSNTYGLLSLDRLDNLSEAAELVKIK